VKRKNILDGIIVRPPTNEEIKSLKSAADKRDKEYELENKPGEYSIGKNFRGAKIKDKTCVVCKESLERVYSIYTHDFEKVMGTKYQSWKQLCIRCPKCGLKYELVGL
jgi:uncharacterized protein with PIN domain